MTKDIYGWLTPRGQFFEVPKYGHLERLRELPQLPNGVAQQLAEVEFVRKGCQELTDEQGATNGEWHCYEMACDEAEGAIITLLREAGFIRVGSMRGELHFEGRGPALADKMQRCKDLAEGYGMTATFERIEVPACTT